MASTQAPNAARVREFRTTPVAGGETDALGIDLSEDTGGRRPVGAPGVETDPVGAGDWGALATAAIRTTSDAVGTAAETVAVRGRLTRSHRDAVQDGDPTRHPIDIATAWMCRFKTGHTGETWSVPDGQWPMEHLGAAPGGIGTSTPPQTPPRLP